MRHPHSRRQGGFSLLELLVALVLGALVTAGMINLFVASRRSFQLQSGDNYLQQNLRFASDRLNWSLRMADFWGGNTVASGTVQVSASAVSSMVSGTSTGNCNSTWAAAINANNNSAFPGSGGVYGYDGSTTFPLDPLCIGGSANYVAGSPVLVVRYADATPLAPGPLVNNFAPGESSTISNNGSMAFALSVPAQSTQIMMAGDIPSAANAAVAANSQMHVYAYTYHVDMFYLQPCDVVPAGGVCNASADNGHPLPTLMRLSLQNGQLVSQPVVDGIEQMGFEYGVITDATGANTTPTYFTASEVTSNSWWPKVVAVRVTLVAVNPTRDVKFPHVQTLTVGSQVGTGGGGTSVALAQTACVYTINAGASPTITNCAGFQPYAYNDQPWQFARATSQFVVQLRNRTRG